MIELKICNKCHEAKEAATEFYLCSGKLRTECKKCTVKRNVKYQKKIKAWKHSYVKSEERRLYMKNYYKNNKDKCDVYRETFKKRYPNYFTEYRAMMKQKKISDSITTVSHTTQSQGGL